MSLLSRAPIWVLLLSLMNPLHVHADQSSGDSYLSLAEAVEQALAHDPWLEQSRYLESALASQAIAAEQLPDPRMTLTMANFPVDNLDLNQEAMTQAMVGLSQVFPRGETRVLKSAQTLQLGGRHPFLRADRQGKVRARVSQLWFELWQVEQTITLIEQDRPLFEQLVDVVEAAYTSALVKSRQQDLIRAQLELTRLEDRIAELQLQRHSLRAQLAEWIGQDAQRPLTAELPAVSVFSDGDGDHQQRLLTKHPSVLALDQQIAASETGVALARQEYKPQWGLSAQYGYRDEDPFGRDRADLVSVGLSFDMPLFTEKRQDKLLEAAIANSEALKTEKALLLRQLRADTESTRARIVGLDARLTLFHNRLLPQMTDHAQSSLTAYNSDTGDFAEAVRSLIAEFNAQIEYLNLQVERHKHQSQLDYLLMVKQNGEPQQTAVTGGHHE